MKYLATLNRDVETFIGHLVVGNMSDAQRTTIESPTTFIQKAGTRQFDTKKRALAFVSAQRSTHGQDVCSDVFTL